MGSETGSELFDWKLYGLLMRKLRLDLGYRKAEDFSDSIWRRTRVKISRDTLYKIEQGRQIPDASQFMALNLALSKSLFNPEVAGMCTSQVWKSLAEGADVPEEWKKENAHAAWRSSTGMESPRDLKHMPSGERAVALLSESAHALAGDAPELFDPEPDNEWHSALEAYLSETYGPDAESWPEPRND